jgi:hypothetical protein
VKVKPWHSRLHLDRAKLRNFKKVSASVFALSVYLKAAHGSREAIEQARQDLSCRAEIGGLPEPQVPQLRQPRLECLPVEQPAYELQRPVVYHQVQEVVALSNCG